MQSEDGFALTLALSPTGTIQMDWVAQPTWLCSAATCRRVWSVAGAHRSVLPESGGLVARQHGQVARATLIFTESFRPRRGNAHSPRWEESLNRGRCGELRKFLPLPGAADAVSAKDKNLLGRGEGERLIPLNQLWLGWLFVVGCRGFYESSQQTTGNLPLTSHEAMPL